MALNCEIIRKKVTFVTFTFKNVQISVKMKQKRSSSILLTPPPSLECHLLFEHPNGPSSQS